MPRIIREEELEKLVSRLDNPASNMSAFGEIIKCRNSAVRRSRKSSQMS